MNFYNEFDPKAAAWLRELIKADEIPEGIVNEKSITEIKPSDLDGFTQCHFFAGIGGWSAALRLAGWPESRPVWTASLPCQPFSTAGQGKGVEDERHLWPVFFSLVKECRPDIIFGEQVARAIGFNWLDGISADLEGENYAMGQAVLGAHSVGSPHKRQRLYWLGISDCSRRKQGEPSSSTPRHWHSAESASSLGVTLGNAKCERLERQRGDGSGSDQPGRLSEIAAGSIAEAGAISKLANLQGSGLENDMESGQKKMFAGTDSHGITRRMEHMQELRRGEVVANGKRGNEGTGDKELNRPSNSSQVTSDTLALAYTGHSERCAEQRNELCERDSRIRESGAWSDYDLIYCRDDCFRRVEAGTFPLAYGVQGRVGLLRGYGNAIVPPLAAQFIQASIEALDEVESK